MIQESSYWKNDLLKLACRLERRLIQERWGEKNFYTVEKEIFIGFYSVRKLIESKRVPDHISGKKYNIHEVPYCEKHRNINIRSLQSVYSQPPFCAFHSWWEKFNRLLLLL